ncbi:uncharacterized protein LOC108431931 [Pygocentrus nattereri]|uniref:uncharacterized protein LOC108431931 n=1 Tax=Pygocentrus nattereri TaxID=42514 RepID=UPI00081437DB|nr:uncharacterized protein LOC108431931 [Pygocentrus nattereri]
MSVVLDGVIKICKAEEAKLTERIRQCKAILRSMKTLVNDNSAVDESASGDVNYDDMLLKDQQEIELLEQVLKRAEEVRSSASVPKDFGADLCKKKQSKTSHSKVPIKNTFKDADKIKTQKVSSSTELQGRGHQRGGSLKGVAVCGPINVNHILVKRRPSPQATTRGKLVTTPAPVQILEDQKKPATHSKDSCRGVMIVGAPSEDKELTTSSQVSSPKEQWVPSPLLPVWRAQRTKKNSLWNEVLTQHPKPLPERSLFRERLISTFPGEWTSDQAAAGGAELDALTQLGLDLTHCYHAELQNRQLLSTFVPGKDPESLMERDYESSLMLEGLERMMAKVINHADHLKKDLERKVGRPLFPLRMIGEWGDLKSSSLPPMLFYSTETELEELDTLRLRVDQLQLEIRLHQAISDTLTHSLTHQQSSSECPSATALRGLYSLLGEGGVRFPALVLDSEPDQT